MGSEHLSFLGAALKGSFRSCFRGILEELLRIFLSCGIPPLDNDIRRCQALQIHEQAGGSSVLLAPT